MLLVRGYLNAGAFALVLALVDIFDDWLCFMAYLECPWTSAFQKKGNLVSS